MNKKLLLYFLFIAITAWATCLAILASPSDPKNALLFGYSLERLILAGGIILFSIPLLFLTWKLSKQPEKTQSLWLSFTSNKNLYFVVFFSFLFLFLFLLYPSYRLGRFASYVLRLQPILVWLTFTTFTTLLIFIIEHRQKTLWFITTENRISLKAGIISLIVFTLITLIVIFTGIGIRRPEDYWYGAGVPVLGAQVLFSLFIGAIFAYFQIKSGIKNNLHFDIAFCLSCFLITAFLWAREPIVPNYFMPDTAKNVMYPYSDSALFDTVSQFALIGQGLFNNVFLDRALYSSFLTYLYLILGQDIEKILTVQAILFSVYPVVIYLIGKELHSRTFGITFAVLIALRGLNAIKTAQWIDLAGPKMMTTDFPTAIGVALFLLCIIKWIKNPSKVYFNVFAGGVLGLILMLRTHVLLLLPATILFILLFAYRTQWNIRLLGSLVLIIGMLIATTPWELRNQKNGYPMFYVYYSRILLILDERYQIQGESSSPNLIVDHNIDKHTKINLIKNPLQETGCDTQVCNITNHFFHNLITSFLFLPSSFMFDSLWNTVKEGAPYWQSGWTGDGITFAESILLLINLFFVSLGIGVAWSKNKWLGIFPLGIFLTYMASNALGMTSAGRYIVPADWIICFYYILGAFQIMLWILRLLKILPKASEQVEIKNEAKGINYRQAFWSLGLVLIIGAFVPASELLFEKRYEVREPELIMTDLEQSGLLSQSGFSQTELLEFLSHPQAMIVEGRALYPRYYPMGEGEPDRSTYYRYLDFSRLVFTVIGPYSVQAQGVVIAGDKPNFSIHASDVIVLGCWNTTYYAPFIDAVIVFINSEVGSYVYQRLPEHPLQCPLQEPRQ
ncbi:MAG TPA: hypothetical protein DHW49_02535 [Anaerolineae bacterium]|nr:hypothetical protein [Anaerolineae bacterium]